MHFVSELQKQSLYIRPPPVYSNLLFARLEASLHDDYNSSLPLKFNCVNNAPLTNLEKAFDPPLTSLPFVAPSFSSTTMDSSVNDWTLFASPLPLAQCIGLEMGVISKGDASVMKGDSLGWSEKFILVEPCLEEAHFQEFCSDNVMGNAAPSIGLIHSICSESLDLAPILSPLLPTTPSQVHAFYECLGDLRGSHPSFDPYCAYLEDVPGEMMWSTFFGHAFDFSMAPSFAPSLLMFCYSHHSKMHATTYDKLL